MITSYKVDDVLHQYITQQYETGLYLLWYRNQEYVSQGVSHLTEKKWHAKLRRALTKDGIKYHDN